LKIKNMIDQEKILLLRREEENKREDIKKQSEQMQKLNRNLIMSKNRNEKLVREVVDKEQLILDLQN